MGLINRENYIDEHSVTGIDFDDADILVEAITKCQGLLAKYIVPHSGIRDREVISSLLGVLDHRDLVEKINELIEITQCPICGSTIVDGRCSDVGGNNCGYTID